MAVRQRALHITTVIAALCSLAEAVCAEEYENLAHRFKLSIPPGFTSCIDEHANDHGVIIYPGTVGCSRASALSNARFWADFNLPDQIEDVEALRNSVCEDRAPVSDITFGGLSLWPCEKQREANRVIEIYIGLRPALGRDVGHSRQVGVAIDAPAADFPAFREEIKDLAANIVLIEPLD